MEFAPDVRAPAKREDTKKLITAFANVAEQWKLSLDEQLALLGNPARSTYFKWKKEGGVLPHDTQDRLSYVFGIYEALQILFPDDQAASSWVRQPNTALVFGGRSAIDLMTRDLVSLHRVRQVLDTERGGWS
jgi:Antitoxin Xre/MbcA/ParS C-terminal toxin-binding domain/Antitoxin Xre-like helix-turn-helix domain